MPYRGFMAHFHRWVRFGPSPPQPGSEGYGPHQLRLAFPPPPVPYGGAEFVAGPLGPGHAHFRRWKRRTPQQTEPTRTLRWKSALFKGASVCCGECYNIYMLLSITKAGWLFFDFVYIYLFILFIFKATYYLFLWFINLELKRRKCLIIKCSN